MKRTETRKAARIVAGIGGLVSGEYGEFLDALSDTPEEAKAAATQISVMQAADQYQPMEHDG